MVSVVFVDVCRGLWDGVEPDTMVWDHETGQVGKPEKVHPLNHDGRFFKVRGPLNTPPSPQGQPVLGLKPTDFHIEEDGRPQQIAQLGDPEQVPLDIALLVDVSGSVVARFDFEQHPDIAAAKPRELHDSSRH